MQSLDDIKEYTNVWDKQVQDILYEHARMAYQKENTGTCIAEVAEAAIKIHELRNRQMIGLYNRSRQVPASAYDWPDPKIADGVPIFARKPSGATKINQKLHTPFDNTIISSKAAYFVGTTPTIAVNEDEPNTEALNMYLDKSRLKTSLVDLAKRATGRGTSFVLLSTPPGLKEMYITIPFEWTGIIIYDTVTGQPKYGIRYWKEIESGERKRGAESQYNNIHAEWYDEKMVYRFKGDLDGLTFMGQEVPHLVDGVPLVEFPNNQDRLGDVELTLALQDAFDTCNSDLSSEISQLRLAYLMLKSAGDNIDDKWVEALKRTGVLSVDENGDAKFLEKNLNATAIENLKTDLTNQIYSFSNSYDPDSLGEDGAMTAYQISRKLSRLKWSTDAMEQEFRVSLTRVIMLISGFYDLNIKEEDLDYTFTRSVPRNVMQDLTEALQSGMQLSQKQLLALFPYDVDFDTNREELLEEQGIVPDLIGEE